MKSIIIKQFMKNLIKVNSVILYHKPEFKQDNIIKDISYLYKVNKNDIAKELYSAILARHPDENEIESIKKLLKKPLSVRTIIYYMINSEESVNKGYIYSGVKPPRIIDIIIIFSFKFLLSRIWFFIKK